MIIYRDPTKAQPLRWPSWLLGAADLCRREAEGGDLIAVGDPLFLADPPPEAWIDLPDGWQVALVQEPGLERLQRAAPGCERLVVHDAAQQPWLAPAVLTPEGEPAIPARLAITGWSEEAGLRTPTWGRTWSPAQQAAIDGARAARAEALARRFDQIPLAAAVAWAGSGLALTYHLTPCVLGVLGLADERLVAGTLLAMSGLSALEP